MYFLLGTLILALPKPSALKGLGEMTSTLTLLPTDLILVMCQVERTIQQCHQEHIVWMKLKWISPESCKRSMHGYAAHKTPSENVGFVCGDQCKCSLWLRLSIWLQLQWNSVFPFVQFLYMCANLFRSLFLSASLTPLQQIPNYRIMFSWSVFKWELSEILSLHIWCTISIDVSAL